MGGKPRAKITSSIVGQTQFAADLRCVVCGEKGDHIHHIDDNPANNSRDNLALLCFEHHNEATLTGGLRRKLSADAIRRYRSNHLTRVAHSRKPPASPVNKDSVFALAEEALLVHEIRVLARQVWTGDMVMQQAPWSVVGDVASKMSRLCLGAGYRVRSAALYFVHPIVISGWGGKIPSDVVWRLGNLIECGTTARILFDRAKIAVSKPEKNLFLRATGTTIFLANGGINSGQLTAVKQAGVNLCSFLRYFSFAQQVRLEKDIRKGFDLVISWADEENADAAELLKYQLGVALEDPRAPENLPQELQDKLVASMEPG